MARRASRKKKVVKTPSRRRKRAKEAPAPVPGPKIGPFTIDLDVVSGMMRELELAHRAMDALGVPPGPLPERLVYRARKWLRRLGEQSQSHIAIDSRNIIKAVGASLYVPAGKGGDGGEAGNGQSSSNREDVCRLDAG